jgi:hypothetical protein
VLRGPAPAARLPSPALIDAILDGRQPVELTTWDLLNRIEVPLAWTDQPADLAFLDPDPSIGLRYCAQRRGATIASSPKRTAITAMRKSGLKRRRFYSIQGVSLSGKNAPVQIRPVATILTSRLAIFLFYINILKAGGESVRPKKNCFFTLDILFWFSLATL